MREYSSDRGGVPGRRLLDRTLLLLVVCGAAVFCLLAVHLFRVMILGHGLYEAQAIRQQTRSVRLPALRGSIVDSRGTVLAQSVTAYDVYLCPSRLRRLGESPETVASGLAEILDLDYNGLLQKCGRRDVWLVTVARGIDRRTADELRRFCTEKGLGSVQVEESVTRIYPLGDLAAQVIGFTGGEGKGLSGLEAVLENVLSGSRMCRSFIAPGWRFQ